MRYLTRVLQPGETVIYETRLHWLIFVRAVVAFGIGLVINLAPGAWYIVALKDIAQSTLSHAEVVVVVVLFCIVMYGLIELPLLGFVFAPQRAADLSRRFSAWLGGNSRRLAVWVLVAGGCYLIARGFLAVA